MLPAWWREISTQDFPRRLCKITEEDLFLPQFQAKIRERSSLSNTQEKAAKLVGALHGRATLTDLSCADEFCGLTVENEGIPQVAGP